VVNATDPHGHILGFVPLRTLTAETLQLAVSNTILTVEGML
jgi:hypothetical protein